MFAEEARTLKVTGQRDVVAVAGKSGGSQNW